MTGQDRTLRASDKAGYISKGGEGKGDGGGEERLVRGEESANKRVMKEGVLI